MTDIQIKYWDYVEGKRHNLVYEGEMNRHNVRTEGQGDVQLVQTDKSISENIRHNMATESIGRTQAEAAQKQASASMLSASAAQRNAATNAFRSMVDFQVANSTMGLNSAKQEQQEYQNQITNATGTTQIASTNFSNLVNPVIHAVSSLVRPK